MLDEVNLSTAAVRRLAAYEPFQELVLTGLVGTDAADSDSDSEKLTRAWLFQGLDAEGRPFRDPEGSGASAVVLHEHNSWDTNQHNTAWFPRLQVLVYADCTRDAEGSPTTRDADAKCKYVARVIDSLFHMTPTQASHQWPGLFVVSCVRSQGLEVQEVPQTEGMTMRGEMTFNAVTG